MRFYLAGHQEFGNRGCEALVRSVMTIVGEHFPGATFVVPSYDPGRDSKQWPELSRAGGEFAEVIPVPSGVKWWNRIATRIPLFRGLWEPRCKLGDSVKTELARCDAVLMIGGDVISLDYGPGSLFRWSTIMDAAEELGLPTMLFAASIGPFDKDPVIERFMVNHLRRYSAITVRETASFAYLKSLGVDSGVMVADPAFRLEPEVVELDRPYGEGGEGVLAFNMSPLVKASWERANSGGDLVAECAAFLDRVLCETRLGVALLPHVDPLDGRSENSDSAFLEQIFARVQHKSARIGLVRRGLNASQIKHVISSSRFLIAARTHATVAGWSQHIPTISIAYSIKARGLNKDLFDCLDYVVETPKVSRNTLWSALGTLIERETAIRQLLGKRIPEWKNKSNMNAEVLQRVFQG